MQSFIVNCYMAIFFALLGFTDFLDGFLARRYGQETELGSVLDPIADKFLLFSSLITLVYLHKIYFFWAIIFIGREFLVMSLRQIAATNNFELKVTQGAKFKTFIQMFYIFWVIINPCQNLGFLNLFNIFESALLLTALYLSIWSIVQYYLTFIKQIGALK